MFLELIFWTAIGVNAATYIGYPLAILTIDRMAPTKVRDRKISGARDPVSIIICAHNEGKAIGPKIASVLNSRYDGDFEVLVGDDGSTDNTADIVASLPDPRIKLRQFPRSGKAAVLKALTAQARHDILVFSDADPIWRDDALNNLIAPLGASDIGAVSGVILTKKAERRLEEGDRVFRDYENLIRRSEDRLFGTISADGGFFAIRREYYEPPPASVTDDFFISTGAVANGVRIAFAEDAVAIEESIATARKHLRRRIRITVRGLASVWARRKLLNPIKFGCYAVGLFFHKVMRRFAPVFIFPAFAALVGLAVDDPYYRLAALTGILGVAISFAAILSSAPAPGVMKLPGYLLLHAWGLAAGCVLFLAGVRYNQWTPAKETSAVAS